MIDKSIENQLEKAVLAPLFDTVVLKIHGEQAEAFLQSQLTNDVSQATAKSAQLQSYCNVKGRAHCVFWLLRSALDEQCFYLIMPKDLIERVQAILKIYLLRSKAVIEIETQYHPLVCINDAEIPDLPDLMKYDMPGKYKRQLLLANEETQMHLKTSQAFNDDFNYNRLHDIYNAIGMVYEASYDSYIPQFLNLDLTNGISFKKGCFPGQEIIARLRYLGKIKYRMLIIQSPTPIAIGDKVFDVENKKAIATVTDCITLASGKTLANIVINTNYIDNTYNLMLNDDTPIQRIEMPYATPIEFASQ